MPDPAKPYGEGRIRSNVSYADVERAAIAILKSERRPTVETIREALGGGSPDTIGNALRRFWRDLGARIAGDPAALSRMPTDIAELADGLWQRALKLAAEAAAHDDNAARERLRQLKVDNDIKRQSLALREREIDTQARERERALADAREHLISLSKALAREQAINASQQQRIAALEQDIEHNRTQIAGLIAAAITRHRAQKPNRSERPHVVAGTRAPKRPRSAAHRRPKQRLSRKAASRKQAPRRPSKESRRAPRRPTR